MQLQDRDRSGVKDPDILYGYFLDLVMTDSKISFDTETSFSFQLENYVKVKNLSINGNGRINLLKLKHKLNANEIKKILLNYNNDVQVKDTDIKFSSEKKNMLLN